MTLTAFILVGILAVDVMCVEPWAELLRTALPNSVAPAGRSELSYW